MQTILDYSDNWVQVYTDVSAFKGTVYTVFGARKEYQYGSFKEISTPCGAHCCIFDAEA